MYRFLCAACFCVFSSAALAQYDTSSGKFFLEACRAVANNDLTPSNPNFFISGACAGQLEALHWVADALQDKQLRSCPPKTITRRQAAKVVVTYMDQHPAILDKPLSALILVALAETWPCVSSN